jgi:hypothetical protein|tara:strand:+ start:402 stop:812 length:411 start_codon:yes stop_codon:yes gene_type:complete
MWKNIIKTEIRKATDFVSHIKEKDGGRLYGKDIYDSEYLAIRIDWHMEIVTNRDSIKIGKPFINEITVDSFNYELDTDEEGSGWTNQLDEVAVDFDKATINFDFEKNGGHIFPSELDIEVFVDKGKVTMELREITF